MAKKIRFPLNMNGTDVRTIEELREHFDLESILGYFANGKLVTWLKDRYYDNEAMAVEVLSAEDSELNQKLMSIFGVSVDNDTAEIDMDIIQRRNEKLLFLRQFTDDKEIIDNVDCVAFNQDDLLDILDEGAEKIYLCQGEFDIPLSVKNITYIGLQNPIVLLRAYDNVNFSSLNLKFVDICFGWDISCTTSADRLYQAERLMEQRRFDEAINILEVLVDEKNPRAFTILAQIYEKIYTSDENKDKMNELHNQGAILGNLFDWIESGKDFAEYKKIFKKLVLKGDRISMGYIGFLYAMEHDFENALKYFKMGAEKNDMFSCEAMYYIYTDDFMGSKVPDEYIDVKKALAYGKKAALLGVAEVANKIGVIYEKGEIVPKDMNEAIKYYKIAAEQDHAWAQFNLGVCYENGKGVKQDYKKAVEWYTKAAKQGNIIAQNNLGYCYAMGEGTEQDYDSALYWYDKAASNGNETAKSNAECLRERIKNDNQIIPQETLDKLKKIEEEHRKKMADLWDDARHELSEITKDMPKLL